MSMRAAPSSSPGPDSRPLQYSEFPPESRIVVERLDTGLRLTLPPVGTWHHAKWGLLFGSWMILPQTTLLIFAVKKMGPRVLERIWKPLVVDATLVPLLGVLVVSFVVGYLMGKIRTSIEVRGDVLELSRELGRFRGKRSWRREELKTIKTLFKHVRIVARRAILRVQFGTKSTAEAKWVARCLRQELGMEPPASQRVELRAAA